MLDEAEYILGPAGMCAEGMYAEGGTEGADVAWTIWEDVPVRGWGSSKASGERMFSKGNSGGRIRENWVPGGMDC